jgi:hypothetical protein
MEQQRAKTLRSSASERGLLLNEDLLNGRCKMAYDFDRCLKEGQRLKGKGLPMEGILRFFRANEASITESMRLLTRLENISLGEAKRIVHFSETWTDFRAGSEELHERAEKAARELEEETARNGDSD